MLCFIQYIILENESLIFFLNLDRWSEKRGNKMFFFSFFFLTSPYFRKIFFKVVISRVMLLFISCKKEFDILYNIYQYNGPAERESISELNFHIWNANWPMKTGAKMAAHGGQFWTSASVPYASLYVSFSLSRDFLHFLTSFLWKYT